MQIPLQQALDFAEYYHNGLLNSERGSVEEEWEKWKHIIELLEQSKKKDITEFINI